MDRLRALLEQLYGNEGNKLANAIQELLPTSGQTTGPASGWITYTVYPDAYFSDSKPGTSFQQLQAQLPRIKHLGCDAIHILPFFRSPGFDMGFDISDFLQPDRQYGSLDDLKALLSSAKELKLKVIIDLILNHISIEHPWFQAAVAGGDRSYFITTTERPTLLEWSSAEGIGEYASYRLGHHTFSQRIIFPTQADPDLPHWEKPANCDWYYYHTFYPHQVDLNWEQPQLFFEFAKILIYWAEQGVSFRLDAIPFIGRNLYTGDVLTGTDGSTDTTHLIAQALRQVLLATAPDSVFLVEASEAPERIQEYLHPGEAQLAYDFQATRSLWAAVATEEPRLLLDHLPTPTSNGQMLVPIRTHDGILLERGNPAIVTVILNALLQESLWPDPITQEIWSRPHSAVYDVPGRTLSLLGENPQKVLLIYFLAACLPGYPMVYYGDELGLVNNIPFMQQQQRSKAQQQGNDSNISAIGIDFRELHRGPVHPEDMDTERANFLSQNLGSILKNRPQICASMNPDPLHPLPKGLLGVEWAPETMARVRAYANLTDAAIEFDGGWEEQAPHLISSAPGVCLDAAAHIQMPAYTYAWVTVPTSRATS